LKFWEGWYELGLGFVKKRENGGEKKRRKRKGFGK